MEFATHAEIEQHIEEVHTRTQTETQTGKERYS